MSIFALVDCNNFFASCERVFNPKLEKQPVVVLSNNDGCIIARSNEAKKLGIPMGAPYYQWKSFCVKHRVRVFSSNYELYGDMSQRVMTILQIFCPDMEIYSIDEAFLNFDNVPLIAIENLNSYALYIRQAIKQYTGLPVSIGIGPTKTLAKIANKLAKKQPDQGVFNLCDTSLRAEILKTFPIEDIWGIGRQLSKRLLKHDIKTAADLRDANLKIMRREFSVVMERMIQELQGISCLPLEAVQPKKQIMSSRSFGKPVTRCEEIEEALSHYTAKACLKLRQQNSLASGVYVFLQTNLFKENAPRYGNSASYFFPEPSCDSRYIIQMAKKCLRSIYRAGYSYHKTGVMLLKLSPQSMQQFNLLTPTAENKSLTIMQTMDLINEKIGKNTLFHAAEGINKEWLMRSDRRSPRYTTRWQELPKTI